MSMSQWASAYVESALNMNKTMGDLLGPCLFAVTMGLSRLIYGKFGEKMNLIGFMMGSGLLCLACYVLTAVSGNAVLSLLGCIFCGFSVGIMWPGTISISSLRIPKGGTAMFALLAMAGDLGGSVGPGLVGGVMQATGDNFRMGMLSGCLFPAVLIVSLILIKRSYN